MKPREEGKDKRKPESELEGEPLVVVERTYIEGNELACVGRSMGWE
jgi:hypothetical protein